MLTVDAHTEEANAVCNFSFETFDQHAAASRATSLRTLVFRLVLFVLLVHFIVRLLIDLLAHRARELAFR